MLKSEIDEGTESRGVQSGNASEQDQHGESPDDAMSHGSIVTVKHPLLHFSSKGEQGQEREKEGHEERDIELVSGIPAEALEIEREHGPIILEGVSDAIRPKQHPAEIDQQKSGDNRKREVPRFPFSVP